MPTARLFIQCQLGDKTIRGDYELATNNRVRIAPNTSFLFYVVYQSVEGDVVRVMGADEYAVFMDVTRTVPKAGTVILSTGSQKTNRWLDQVYSFEIRGGGKGGTPTQINLQEQLTPWGTTIIQSGSVASEIPDFKYTFYGIHIEDTGKEVIPQSELDVLEHQTQQSITNQEQSGNITFDRDLNQLGTQTAAALMTIANAAYQFAAPVLPYVIIGVAALILVPLIPRLIFGGHRD